MRNRVMEMKIGIIGAGSWGTAVGVLLSKKGHEVYIWDRDSELIEQIINARENLKYLPGILLPASLKGCHTNEEAVNGADVIVMAVPSQAVRSACQGLKGHILEKQIIVSLAKGIEMGTYKTPSSIIEEYFPDSPVCVISGPSHAEEVSRDVPTAVVCASRKQQMAEYIQDLFISPKFRVYTNPDVIGVEIGGAVKNIIALAAGISDGLGFGDNTKAALMTRGIAEISRLGEAMGAEPQTFSGLSGIGDLIVTCTSMHSRNRRAGILIGQGKSVEEALKEVRMVVEGVNTTRSTYELAESLNIDMPITDQLYKVLFEGKSPLYAVSELMLRDKKHEIEEVVQKMW
jgi:glycerol-3-phosphate dehydrogenase (NAD(P)+)